MLSLELGPLERGPMEWREEIPLEDGPWSDTDLRFGAPPEARLRAAQTGSRGVHVTGEVGARVVLDCRRCLEDVPRDLDVELDLLFDPGVEKEGDEEQVYLLEAEADVLDLAPAIREQLLLEVPPYPLCREDCRGLCPRCGIDRNETSCDCTLTEPDPRWDALRDLKEEMQAEDGT
jgi:uncharacterized protein